MAQSLLLPVAVLAVGLVAVLCFAAPGRTPSPPSVQAGD
jgi:hypothetical protein